MRRWRLVGLATILLLAGAPATATAAPGHSPELVGVYPNPVADGDAGEYVVVADPPREPGWTITDGETNVSLPPASAPRVRYTDEPSLLKQRIARTRSRGSAGGTKQPNTTVIGLEEPFSLSNAGETIRLQRRGEVVQSVTYADAPEGERYERRDSGWSWRSPGATNFSIRSFETDRVTAFALPDAPGPPLATLRNASRRLWLAGYTFTSALIADVLIEAHREGASVRVLLEGEPVGGVAGRQRRQLNRLVRAGIDVRVIGGAHARYRYHHPKYAVVDDRALVMSENWKPAGVGGNASRGWGVIVEPPPGGESTADAMSRVFRADWGWRDAIEWAEHRETLPPASESGPLANASYPSRHPARSASAERVELLLAPENTRAGVLDLIGSAEHSLDIEQPTLGAPDGPFVRAVLAAAERGVEVRILLDRSWYVREDNRALVEALERKAAARSLPVQVKLVEPRGRFEKIHAKGVIVDEERVLVGSLNWNDNAITANREVSLVLHSEGVAGYFTSVFEADWSSARRLPLGLTSLAGAALLAVVIGLAWGLSFESEGP